MRLLLKATRVIDGTGGPVGGDDSVLIDGSRIERVGRFETFSTHDQRSAVDLGDCTLMPGMIDAHTHLSMTPKLHDYGGHMRDPLPVLTLRAANNIREDLESGVTTVRCLGDKDFLDFACQQAVEDGMLPGPHIIPSGKGIRATNGHGAAGTPADGIDAVLRMVRENLHAGAKVIKLFISGDIKEDNVTNLCYSPAEIHAAVEESLRADVRLAAHLMGGPGVKHFVEAGGDMVTVEHGGFLTEDDLKLMIDRGAWLGVTCNSGFREERLANLRTPELTAKVQAQGEQVLSNYRMCLDAGVRFTLGTDAQHGEMWYEPAFIVKNLGVDPLRAIHAATLGNATAIGIGDDRGSIEAGKRADIIAVAGDPSRDIEALRHVTLVIKDGAPVAGSQASMISLDQAVA